jgi:hypothetical protein
MQKMYKFILIFIDFLIRNDFAIKNEKRTNSDTVQSSEVKWGESAHS